MHVLVIGGNGFVGRHLVTALLERGDHVTVMALETENTEWLERHHVEVWRGDVRAAGSLAEPVQGADAVINLAAMMDVWRPIADYRSVNVAGAVNVARAVLDAGAGRLVHMSSSSVYGMGHGHPVDETSPLLPFADPYPVTKAEGDRAIQRMIADDGLSAVIIRPDQIFGPGDHLHFGQMAARLLAGRGIIVGSGANRMPFVYISDIVDALVLAVDHPRAVGEAFNITSERPLTQLQFMTSIAHEVGAPAPRTHVPYSLLYAAGFAAELATRATGSRRRPPVTRLGVAFFGTDNLYETAKARELLGFRAKVAVSEGIRRSAAWYLEQARGLQAAVASGVALPEEA